MESIELIAVSLFVWGVCAVACIFVVVATVISLTSRRDDGKPPFPVPPREGEPPTVQRKDPS